MKKIVIVILVVTLATALAACTPSNRQTWLEDTNNFTWAIIQLGNGELIEGEVASWRDFENSDTVQFTMNGITYLTHYSNVILSTERP